MQGEPHWADELDVESASRIVEALEEGLAMENEEGEAGGEPGLFPGYRVDRPIGEGGAGMVYRAFREGSDRPVAIKQLRTRFRRGAKTERAWRELQVLSQLRLPAVPAVLDYGVAEGRLYVVTEFVKGLNLDEHCEEGSLDVRSRVELLARTAEAVQSLHEHGVIHRDLKPSNILINPHGQPMIIDLGVASLLTDDVTETLVDEGVPIGSPAFMSPEQASGRRDSISTRSDVYGLGATAYVVLTGEPPHEMAETIAESVRRVSQDPARDPRVIWRSLPSDLAAVLSKAVAHEPGGRYATAQAFADDLRRWLRGEAVLAKGRSAWARATAWAGRHPLLVTTALSLGIAATLIGSSFVTRWWLRRVPVHAVISPDGSTVGIYSASGELLREWDAHVEGRIIFADILRRPRELGGGRVLLLGLQEDRTSSEEFGHLVCYHVSELQTPAWSSVGTIHLPPMLLPALEGTTQEAYLLRAVFLEEIFPERPGPEIVAVHQHTPYTPSVIRVYDLAGAVLYEVWNDGHISDVHWVPGPRLLVAVGKNSDGRWDERGAEPQGAVYPTVVFAVQPQISGEPQVLCWPGFEGTTQAAWYWCLWPPEISAFLAGGGHEFVEAPNRQYDPRNTVQFSITTTTKSYAGYNWILDAAGDVVAEYETAAWAQEAALPPIDALELRELPPRTKPRE